VPAPLHIFQCSIFQNNIFQGACGGQKRVGDTGPGRKRRKRVVVAKGTLKHLQEWEEEQEFVELWVLTDD
jgi:hypothetical protein